MSLTTTQTHPKLLWPGQKEIWGDFFYKQHPEEYSQYMEVTDSNQMFEEYTGITGFGLVPEKGQGQPLVMDAEKQGFVKRFTNVAYALGYQITKEELMDNLYKKVSSARMPALARSMRQTIETVAANHINRAEDSNYKGADGVELLSSLHLNVNGGTWSNELGTPADLSESSLEDICKQVDQVEDDRGLQAMIRPKKLLIHPNDRYTAIRILQSDLQNDTANNATNALARSGMLSDGFVVGHFLTDTDAWGVTTDCPFGLVFIERSQPDVEQDNDFSTKSYLVSGYMRNCSGWVDARGYFGSGGAA